MSAAEPLWFGDWGATPEEIKALETRELIREGETYVYGKKVPMLLYKTSEYGGMASINYVFGPNGLAHCTVGIMVPLRTDCGADCLKQNYNKLPDAKINDPSARYKPAPPSSHDPKAEVILVKGERHQVMLITKINVPQTLMMYDIIVYNPADKLNKEWLAIFGDQWREITRD